jgi:phage gp46-like protein
MNSDKSAEVAVAEMRCCSYTEIVADAQNCLEAAAAVEVEAAVVADSALFLACSRTKPDKSRTMNTLVVETCLW